MKLLRIISSVNPANGGPMEGARKIDGELRQIGHEVEVVCLDAPGSAFLASYPAIVHAIGPGKYGYAYSEKLLPWLDKNANRFDAAIVNGIWQYHSFAAFLAFKKINLPYFVFTHGMLDPWFKKKYPVKHLKKWMYWPWAEYRVLKNASAVLFTSEEERRSAPESFWLYKANALVTAYGTADVPPMSNLRHSNFFNRYPSLENKRIILFLGRIHEKKGCDLLIEAFSKLAAEYEDVVLAIAGPDSNGLRSELVALSDSLKISDRIHWLGMLQGDDKWNAMHSCEVFCLPSHQENFGIAVAEALACGKPVVISNKVNIWREIHEERAGWVGDDSIQGTEYALRQWLETDANLLAKISENSRKCFEKNFRIDKVVSSLVRIIQPFVR